MIPKIVHFCWLSGDKYPEKIKFCIDSWKEKLTGYDIVLWDLNRFDINSSIWCKEAFEAKKFAFAADYIRCYALYYYGGIYLDSDVEVIKTFDPLLDLPYFIGKERKANIEPAIMGAEKGWNLLKLMLDYYKERHFLTNDNKYDLTTMPTIMERIIVDHYQSHLINNISDFTKEDDVLNIFEADYFSPKYSNVPRVEVSKNTYSIHHFEASWFPADKKMYRLIHRYFGSKIADSASYIYKFYKSIFSR